MEVTVLTVDSADLPSAAALLDAFNREYDDPSPGVQWLTSRLADLIAGGATDVLVLRDPARGPDLAGVAVLRLRPALWSDGLECYLAELYVVPALRNRGLGSHLLSTCLGHARARGADHIDLGTSEDDVSARYVYAKHGFIRTEGGPDGPIMFVYEREL